jgi:hypothetical protein
VLCSSWKAIRKSLKTGGNLVTGRVGISFRHARFTPRERASVQFSESRRARGWLLREDGVVEQAKVFEIADDRVSEFEQETQKMGASEQRPEVGDSGEPVHHRVDLQISPGRLGRAHWHVSVSCIELFSGVQILVPSFVPSFAIAANSCWESFSQAAAARFPGGRRFRYNSCVRTHLHRALSSVG